LVNYLLRDEIVTSNYKVATLIPSQLGIVTGSIMIYLFPIVAKISNNRLIIKTAVKVQLLNGIIIGAITILGFIFTPLIINVVYGSNYGDTVNLSRLFWIVFGINAGFRMIPMNIMPAIGRVKFNACMAIGTSVVH